MSSSTTAPGHLHRARTACNAFNVTLIGTVVGLAIDVGILVLLAWGARFLIRRWRATSRLRALCEALGIFGVALIWISAALIVP